jgi:DNA-binding NarL/FixJ family response regulator
MAMEGLRALVEASGDVRVVATETTLEDAADALAELPPGILVVDKRYGAPALRALIGRDDFASAVIVWGTGLNEPEALRLLHSGVSGVVSKTASLTELEDCVRSVASGRKWMDMFERSEVVH